MKLEEVRWIDISDCEPRYAYVDAPDGPWLIQDHRGLHGDLVFEDGKMFTAGNDLMFFADEVQLALWLLDCKPSQPNERRRR